MKRTTALLPLILLAGLSRAQDGGTLDLEHLYDIPSDCRAITMTMRHDARDLPYLYVASKDGGLKIYDLRNTPVLVNTIPVSELQSLDVCSLSQSGRFLYLALGNSFARAKQPPGLAVIDVTDPSKPRVASVWNDSQVKSGAGVVECVGDYVYLGAMKQGLMIFDVGTKRNIQLVGSLVPDIHFPDRKADPEKVNARGMAIRDDLVYLCYDAGGFRIIDVADKTRPREIGRYSNPVMNGKPRAYNHVVLDGPLAYIAVDYCGVEILDIRDATNIQRVSWWNPWNCQKSGWKWFTSPGHANEVAIDRANKLLFISTGKGDLHVLDIHKPASPSLLAVYGGPDNGIGTWGVSRHADRVYLSYICTFGIPFKSNWTGVKILSYRYRNPQDILSGD